MYFSAGEHTVLSENTGMEDTILNGEAEDAFHIGGRLIVEVGGEVVVEEVVGMDIVAFAAVDAGEGAH